MRGKYVSLLAAANITLNGTKPWDMQIKDKRLWRRIFFNGNLGMGEGYMEGWFEVDDLCEFFNRLTCFFSESQSRPDGLLWHVARLTSLLTNRQTQRQSKKAGGCHYDIGNHLYSLMLGSSMAYSCGYWKNAQNLDESQTRKFHLVAQKLGLEPGMRILDVGCGFGSAMAFFSKEYGVDVDGVTISKEQANFARTTYPEIAANIHFMDYRELKGSYDRIYSIGMFEHVGYKNYNIFMGICRRLLKKDGLMLLHSIGKNDSETTTDRWINKYIFPNSMLPSLTRISASCERRFVIEDVQNFGYDYHRTLLAWHDNFESHWKEELSKNYDEKFRRMWRYYLLSCAGAFKSRYIQLYQVVLSPLGVSRRYDAPR